MTTPHVVRLDPVLLPDPSRVIIKLFVPGEDAVLARNRAAALIERIAHLDPEESDRLLADTLDRFGPRHRDLEATFQHHYDLVHHRVAPSRDLSAKARLLVGAYFSHEYAVEAAALCNPSMVPHPDQSALAPHALRTAISLRQIGEGHLSSIGFATAVLGPGTGLTVGGRSGPLRIGRHSALRHRRDLLAAGLVDEDRDDEVTATVLGSLPEHFDDRDFEQALAGVPAELSGRGRAQGTLEQLRRAVAASYAVSFPTDVPLEQRVLWPATPAECNGMEDARFVRFHGDAATPVYRATYTAYDGRHIGIRMLASDDLSAFAVTPMRGPAARNKGMALFPRPVRGRQLALCRSDGETLGLTTLDDLNRWQHPVPLHRPNRGRNLIQVGNCGSPLETDTGWLVLTHGVGPVRRYTLGALLLDLDRPERVTAELPGELLAPDDSERDGYVPNVVYSCGGLIHAGILWLPYGTADNRVRFATITLSEILDAMERVTEPP